MDKPIVLVPEIIHPIGLELLGQACRVIVPDEQDGAAIENHRAAAQALVVRVALIDAALMDRSPRLRVIAKHGVGVDNIDLAAATERGIAVLSTPGANADAVAEAALTMMLALLKQVIAAHRAVAENRYAARDALDLGDLYGKTIGIVGGGRIGSRVARICGLGFKMRVLIYDPYLDDAAIAAMRAERATSLLELLPNADVISLHTPLTAETKGMIGAAALAAMKPGAILINTARGPIVDAAALVDALLKKRILGAGLDVFDPEPPPADSPLFELPNVVLAPHMAGVTQGSRQQMARGVAEGILAVLAGRQPAHLVNGEVWRQRRR